MCLDGCRTDEELLRVIGVVVTVADRRENLTFTIRESPETSNDKEPVLGARSRRRVVCMRIGGLRVCGRCAIIW